MADDPQKPEHTGSEIRQQIEERGAGGNIPAKKSLGGEMPTADHQRAQIRQEHLRRQREEREAAERQMSREIFKNAPNAGQAFKNAHDHVEKEKGQTQGEPVTGKPFPQPRPKGPMGQVAGENPRQVSPQLREKEDPAEKFRKRMLARKEFNDRARDIDRDR